MRSIPNLLLCLAAILALSTSCDSLAEDVAPANLNERTDVGNFEVYTFPGGATVINIQEWIVAATPANSNGRPSTFQISQQPQYGNISLDPRGYVIYESFNTITQATDYIGFRIVHEDQSIANYLARIHISSDRAAFPCDAGAISDSIAIKTDSEHNLLDVLSNDRICTDAAVLASVSAIPSRGNLSVINNTFTYTPNAGYNGSDYFIYQICQTIEGKGTRCTLAYVQLEVSPDGGACAPLAKNDEYNIAAYIQEYGEAEYVALDVLENDELCADELSSFTITGAAQKGNTYIEGNKIYYQPGKGYTGADSLRYEICNTAGNCSGSSVSLNLL
ncbi:Ig-like domain-containing protein [Cesiribacter sp. SM1]|uniref:Ig-like domain-containing protein n=1 Tax=Cesiribacter sp. SM1 TaxID=2861196 RepID=UPI001CD5A448|nr:Ig-like domain-containing protein [Cesiribacter sp. SM1]